MITGKHLPVESMGLDVCTLYAALPAEQQARAFAAAVPGTRKVILATNIAETSVTINGVNVSARERALGYDLSDCPCAGPVELTAYFCGSCNGCRNCGFSLLLIAAW